MTKLVMQLNIGEGGVISLRLNAKSPRQLIYPPCDSRRARAECARGFHQVGRRTSKRSRRCDLAMVITRFYDSWNVGELGRTLDGGKIYQMYLDEKHVPDPKGDLSSRVNHGVPRQVHSGQVRSANK